MVLMMFDVQNCILDILNSRRKTGEKDLKLKKKQYFH
jgi:hypothetical protein